MPPPVEVPTTTQAPVEATTQPVNIKHVEEKAEAPSPVEQMAKEEKQEFPTPVDLPTTTVQPIEVKPLPVEVKPVEVTPPVEIKPVEAPPSVEVVPPAEQAHVKPPEVPTKLSDLVSIFKSANITFYLRIWTLSCRPPLTLQLLCHLLPNQLLWCLLRACMPMLYL